MKNIFLTLAIIFSATLFVNADFFPTGSTATYVDNGTGLDVTINISWGTNTTEWGDGFVVTIDGVDYYVEGGTGAWGDPGSAFFGTLPSGLGDFTTSPTVVTITIPYPAGWMPGDPIDILIDGYGDAYGDDPTGVNSSYLDEPAVATEFVPPPPPVVVDCGGPDADEFFNSGEDPAGNGVVSSTIDDAGAPLGAICADDFVVGAAGLDLDGILAYGFFSAGTGTATDITVIIYDDAGGIPGAVVCSYTEVPSYVGGAFMGDFGVDFSSTCSLPAGTYWISVEVNGTGRWNWLQSAGQQGAEAQLIDPNDYFMGGFTSWTGFTALGLAGDMGFGLYSCGAAPPCDLTITVEQVTCDDAGTSDDASDDIIEYTVTVSGGTGTWSDAGIGVAGQAYGTPTAPIMVTGAGSVTVTAIDDADPTCTATLTDTLVGCAMPGVPTLSQWGLMTLALLLMIFGAVKIGAPAVQTSFNRKN